MALMEDISTQRGQALRPEDVSLLPADKKKPVGLSPEMLRRMENPKMISLEEVFKKCKTELAGYNFKGGKDNALKTAICVAQQRVNFVSNVSSNNDDDGFCYAEWWIDVFVVGKVRELIGDNFVKDEPPKNQEKEEKSKTMAVKKQTTTTYSESKFNLESAGYFGISDIEQRLRQAGHKVHNVSLRSFLRENLVCISSKPHWNNRKGESVYHYETVLKLYNTLETVA